MASLPVPINVSFSRASGVVTTWLILTKPQHGKRHIYKDDFSFSLFLPPSFSISEIQELRLGKGKWWGQGSTAGGVSLVAMDIVSIWLFFFLFFGHGEGKKHSFVALPGEAGTAGSWLPKLGVPWHFSWKVPGREDLSRMPASSMTYMSSLALSFSLHQSGF